MLTGGSGSPARHVARRLLGDGYRVRATLRTPSREGEVRAAVLPGLSPDAGDRLPFVRADLDADEGWAEAIAGAAALIHAAFPFRSPVRATVTRGYARPWATRADVARVVLTSSVVAIRRAGSPLVQDETHWADPETRSMTPRARSKTLAERAAWELAASEGLALTAINPSLLLGPILGGTAGTSAAVVARLLRGRDPMVPNLDFTAVDARDVAVAHVLALSRPATAGERIALVAGSLSFPSMARVLKAAHPERRIPTRTAPDWLVRAMSLAVPNLCTVVPLLEVPQLVSNAKARALLGIASSHPRRRCWRLRMT